MGKALIGNVRGPKGDKGEKGDIGAQGPQGAQGVPGFVNADAGIEFEDYSSGTVPITDTALNAIKTGTSLRSILGNVKAFLMGTVTKSKVLKTVEEVAACNNTEDYLAGAGVVKQLNNSLGGLKFGTDSSGNYGYYKVGADSVTPFKIKDVVEGYVTVDNAGATSGGSTHFNNLPKGTIITINQISGTGGSIFSGSTVVVSTSGTYTTKNDNEAIRLYIAAFAGQVGRLNYTLT